MKEQKKEEIDKQTELEDKTGLIEVQLTNQKKKKGVSIKDFRMN